VDPEHSNLPTAEPTPGNPVPTQTAPVTPESNTPPPVTPKSTAIPQLAKLGSNKKLWAAIIGAVIIIGGLIFLFLSPWSPFVSAAPTGPKLMVGNNRYVHACSVLNKDVVAKELDIKNDINKENTNENFAYDPANTTDQEVDLAKKTGSESLYSRCTLKLDRVQEGSGEEQTTSFINVVVTLEQFPNETKARNAFKSDKQKIVSPKVLPSFKDTSYYGKPRAASASQTVTTVQPKILHKNMIVGMSTPTKGNDPTGEQNANKLDVVAKDLISRIDKHEGDKPKNYNGINKLGDNPFTDACMSINYAKVAAALGNSTQFNTLTVGGSQAYAPDNNGGTRPNQLTSGCVLPFRTGYEADQAKNYQPPQGLKTKLDYPDQFPHYLSLQIAVTENKDKAKELLESARKQGQENAKDKQTDDDKAAVEDVQLGDGGVKITLEKKYQDSTGAADGESLGQLYYITKGPNVYIIATTYVKQEKPIKAETRTLELDQVKKIYKEMTMATRRAN
jgi:hypothetical protein